MTQSQWQGHRITQVTRIGICVDVVSRAAADLLTGDLAEGITVVTMKRDHDVDQTIKAVHIVELYATNTLIGLNGFLAGMHASVESFPKIALRVDDSTDPTLDTFALAQVAIERAKRIYQLTATRSMGGMEISDWKRVGDDLDNLSDVITIEVRKLKLPRKELAARRDHWLQQWDQLEPR